QYSYRHTHTDTHKHTCHHITITYHKSASQLSSITVDAHRRFLEAVKLFRKIAACLSLIGSFLEQSGTIKIIFRGIMRWHLRRAYKFNSAVFMEAAAVNLVVMKSPDAQIADIRHMDGDFVCDE